MPPADAAELSLALGGTIVSASTITCTERAGVVQALRARDVAEAAEAISLHLDSAGQRLITAGRSDGG